MEEGGPSVVRATEVHADYEHQRQSKHITESMDFEEMESVMWRKHQLRRFFQDRGHWWTNSRRSTAWKWILVIITGILIGIMGYIVAYLTGILTSIKFNIANGFIADGYWFESFFSFMFFCILYAIIAGVLCWIEPAAAGSGIPEIKAYLNGVNLNKVVRIRVLFAKVIGVCFSCSAGLPLGKEGPMIHAGAIVGAAVSQGKTITFGFDTSWTKFQDLRNDRSKRDFVTFGAAAGVAAAFSAPIGGILFTLEEGASFWSTTLTFRAFFCAMITQLTLNVIYSGFQLGINEGYGLFAFGFFNDFEGYATYELFFFALIGVAGGILGSFFNYINKRVTLLRFKYIQQSWKRMIELLILTLVMSLISFILPVLWGQCTPIPTNTSNWTSQELELLTKLVQFQCKPNFYNQLASLYFAPSDTAMQQLYHFKEIGGTNYVTFETGALMLFFVPYFLLAAITSGALCPAGLFVPTLLSGAAFGRMIGHILNCAFPGYVTDSGTYALVGASAILGGMSRMTIAGTVIILEASGNSGFLLPLMLTFAAARYTGNAINEPMYDMHIGLKGLPFLEGSLKTLGLLNYHPIAEIMSQPVITLNEINRVGTVHNLLSTKTHNGFPVVDKKGHLRGFILRKSLCNIIKLKAFSPPVSQGTYSSQKSVTENDTSSESDLKSNTSSGMVQLAPIATVFHDTLERNYPHYPKIEDISLTPTDMNCWLDVRPYMDTAPYSINSSSSLQRCYRFFRTMGLRHLVVLDNDHRVTGIITRQDITEHRLEHHWFHEGDNMQKFVHVEPIEPGMVYEGTGLLQPNDDTNGNGGDDSNNLNVDFSQNPLQRGQQQPVAEAFQPPVTFQSNSSTPGRNRDVKSMKEPKGSKIYK
eukprot:gene10242-13776_t